MNRLLEGSNNTREDWEVAMAAINYSYTQLAYAIAKPSLAHVVLESGLSVLAIRLLGNI